MEREFRLMTNFPRERTNELEEVLARRGYKLDVDAEDETRLLRQYQRNGRRNILVVCTPYSFEVDAYREDFESDPSFVSDVKLMIIADPGKALESDFSDIYDLITLREYEARYHIDIKTIRAFLRAKKFNAHGYEIQGSSRDCRGLIVQEKVVTIP